MMSLCLVSYVGEPYVSVCSVVQCSVGMANDETQNGRKCRLMSVRLLDADSCN